MKLKVITTSNTTDHPGWHKLKASLERFGYDYEHILQPFSFGHQLPIVRDWCNNYKGDCTHLLYTDCYDTVAFSDEREVISKYPADTKMFISGEKACFPHPECAKDYPETLGPWKYVNGGGWLVEIEYFKQLCIKENLNPVVNDQVFLMVAFLRNQNEIKIDNDCTIFQTIAFSKQNEWDERETRFLNVGTGTFPVFFHGNGKTFMDWVYKKFENGNAGKKD